jgi:hypothetical protein
MRLYEFTNPSHYLLPEASTATKPFSYSKESPSHHVSDEAVPRVRRNPKKAKATDKL